MANDLTITSGLQVAAESGLSLSDDSLSLLASMYYPQASDKMIRLAHAFCVARGVDHAMRPVYVVPTWDSKQGRSVESLWPSIHLYRVIASRSMHAGTSDVEYGPEIEMSGEVKERGAKVVRSIKIPEWARVTVKRALPGGSVAEFTATVWARELGKLGGQWLTMPRHMLGIRAESHALRKGFPEVGGMPTWDEVSPATVEAQDDQERPPMQAPKRLAQKQESAPAIHEAEETDAVPMASANQIKVVGRKVSAAGFTAEQVAEIVGREVSPDLSGLTLAEARALRSAAEEAIEQQAVSHEPEV